MAKLPACFLPLALTVFISCWAKPEPAAGPHAYIPDKAGSFYAPAAQSESQQIYVPVTVLPYAPGQTYDAEPSSAPQPSSYSPAISVPEIQTSGTDTSAEDPPLIVTTLSGRVRGLTATAATGKQVDVWNSIPFGKPPLGELHFRHPLPMDPWDGILDTRSKPNSCWQTIDDFYGNFIGSRGGRTHVGHCLKLDSVLKYSKNCFKILDFTRIVLDVMMLEPV